MPRKLAMARDHYNGERQRSEHPLLSPYLVPELPAIQRANGHFCPLCWPNKALSTPSLHTWRVAAILMS